MTKAAKFEDLFQEGLEDLHDAEKQTAEALPKMIAAASSQQLKAALEADLSATKEHASRLETILERPPEESAGRECAPMAALLDSGAKLIGDLEKSTVLDAGIVATAQKVQHYDIAGYRTVGALAEVLEKPDAFAMLDQTLEEEEDIDQLLTDVGDAILSGDQLDRHVATEEKRVTPGAKN